MNDFVTMLASKYPELYYCSKDICDAIDKIVNCYKKGGKVLLCGNR